MIHGADVSEFQEINWPAYDSDFVIIRVHNGNRPDHKWSTARSQGARNRCKVLGYYGYIVADRDAAEQGRAFAAAFKAVAGNPRPGEFFVADMEIGAGQQLGRAEAWCKAVDQALGVRCWIYSYPYFYNNQMGGTNGRYYWTASYQNNPPPGTYKLWQHTDKEIHRGIVGPVDCSIYPGTIEDLYKLVSPSNPAPKPVPYPILVGEVVTPQDIEAIAQAVYEKVNVDFVTELRGTPDGKHVVNLTAITQKLDAIAKKVGL